MELKNKTKKTITGTEEKRQRSSLEYERGVSLHLYLDVASERVSWQKSSDFSPLGSVGSSAGKEAGEAWRARAASMTRQAWGQYRHATYLPPSTPHPPPIHAESDLLLLSNSFFCITRTLNAHAYINTRESTPTTARCV